MSVATNNVRHVPLGEICTLVNGRAFKPEEWGPCGLPIIRIQNLNDEGRSFNHFDGPYDQKHEVNAGDLLFSWSGTPGTSFGAFFWTRQRGVLNQHIFNVLTEDHVVFKPYLRYAMNDSLVRIIDQAHGGVGLKHITKAKLEAIQIPLPPLAEQKRIADILDKADAIRRKRQQAIEQLDTLVQATFLDMFGDPVTNPMGWEVGSLQDVSTKITDGTHNTPKYTDTGIEFLSAKDLKDGEIRWDTGKFISEVEHAQLIKRCNPERGDLLLAKSGSLGSIAIIDRERDFSLFESLCLIKRDQEKIDAPFLACMIRNPTMQVHLLRKNKGVAIKHLHLVDVRSLNILIPPLKEQQRFARIVESIEQQKARMRCHLEELDSLFASLQQRAFAGEL